MAAAAVGVPASAAPPWVETIASGDHMQAFGDTCVGGATAAAGGCFVKDDDTFVVVDGEADHHSAAIVWQDYRNGALYRQGACVEKRGAHITGGCNMNFYEDSTLSFKACTYEAGASGSVPDKIVACGESRSVGAA